MSCVSEVVTVAVDNSTGVVCYDPGMQLLVHC